MKSSPQLIDIFLNFIGEVEFLNTEREPSPEEIAEQERIEKERGRNRKRYQKRKASGYYDKQKAERNNPCLTDGGEPITTIIPLLMTQSGI